MRTHYLLFCCMLASLSACGISDDRTPFQQVANGDPIKPIQTSSDKTTVILTDYVPTLASEPLDQLWLDNRHLSESDSTLLQADPARQFTITASDIVSSGASQHVHFLTLSQGDDRLQIPILPPLAREQGFYATSIDEEGIHVTFTETPDDVNFSIFWQNQLIVPCIDIVRQGNAWIIPFPKGMPAEISDSKGRSWIRIYAVGAFCEGKELLYNDLLLPLQDGKIVEDAHLLTRHDPHSQVLYSLMVDRFNNGNPRNDWKMNSPEVLDIVDYQGGDLAGITQKIEDGFFDDLGVNTLWISPITQNPWDAWGYYTFTENADGSYNNKYDPTRAYTKFSGYHGYWPIYATQIDHRFGTESELKCLLQTAHKHHINVILDYVANHMHINSPTLQEHPDWHTDSILPDGRRNFELWDEARLTTWFDRHIPTLDLEREDVYQPMTDSALYWLEHFDLDGFRHDACKHIPEVYWRTLTQKMKSRFPHRSLWMIGETYGSPELIGSYIKTGMLDAQFDFNHYFTTIHALVEAGGDMREVNNTILQSLAAYGSHHTMGNISGNHDQVRFASLAGGAISFSEDGKEAGWTRHVGIGDAPMAYSKALLLEVINLTIPGVPCIYQGDEYGEAGGNDPDNRHMMRFSGLTREEQQMREAVKELIHLRRQSMPLLYGEYLPVYADTDILCFKRVYLGQQVLVAVNKSAATREVPTPDGTIIVPALSYIIQ